MGLGCRVSGRTDHVGETVIFIMQKPCQYARTVAGVAANARSFWVQAARNVWLW